MKLKLETDAGFWVVVEHGDQTLMFDLQAFGKRQLLNNDITAHINQYWATLPGVQQQLIFETYRQVAETFELVSGTSAWIQAMLPLIKQLYDQHDLRRMREWILLNNEIIIPEKFKDAYVQTDDRPFTRDRTYTKPDYIELLVLSLALRAMVPIWGEFIYRTKDETGTDFKEYYAFALLNQTSVMETAAVAKLRVYIQGNLQDDKPLTNVIISGISRDDYPNWLLAKVMVRRLSVGDLRGVAQNTDLVVTIHNDLSAQNNPGGSSNFGEPIQIKQFGGDDGDEQGVSRLEHFKIKALHSAGEIASIEHYMGDPFAVAKRLDPSLNPGTLMEFLESGQALKDVQLWPCQIGLTQWVMAPVIPPRGMDHLDKISTLRAMAVAQTYLWQHGHKHLAALLAAMACDNTASFQQTGTASMARITADQKIQLAALFPYNTVSPSRTQTEPKNKGETAIDELAGGFIGHDWLLTVPDAMAVELTGRQHYRRMSCPHMIKQMLAALAIECAQQKH